MKYFNDYDVKEYKNSRNAASICETNTLSMAEATIAKYFASQKQLIIQELIKTYQLFSEIAKEYPQFMKVADVLPQELDLSPHLKTKFFCKSKKIKVYITPVNGLMISENGEIFDGIQLMDEAFIRKNLNSNIILGPYRKPEEYTTYNCNRHFCEPGKYDDIYADGVWPFCCVNKSNYQTEVKKFFESGDLSAEVYFGSATEHSSWMLEQNNLFLSILFYAAFHCDFLFWKDTHDLVSKGNQYWISIQGKIEAQESINRIKKILCGKEVYMLNYKLQCSIYDKMEY